MNRRRLCSLAAAAAAAPFAPARADQDDFAAGWLAYRTRFLADDGRIVDTGNGGISHSEGQGWGMLFAEAAGDLASFDLIAGWTAKHLARPHDSLHAWRYDPAAATPVSDLNNATDGDIFIAWALSRAARRWGRRDDDQGAAAIAAAILKLLCVQEAGHFYLLPGVSGFTAPGMVTLNPSYYVFPAFDALADLAPCMVWEKLRQDGLDLLQKAVFGAWSLPPDWLSVTIPDRTLAPAAPWPPRFGYDAIRVPLWLSWAGLMPPKLGAAFAGYWQAALPYRPAWVDLQDGTYAGYPAPAGMEAVADLTLASLTHDTVSFPPVADAQDYYSASLIMLAQLAEQERFL